MATISQWSGTQQILTSGEAEVGPLFAPFQLILQNAENGDVETFITRGGDEIYTQGGPYPTSFEIQWDDVNTFANNRAITEIPKDQYWGATDTEVNFPFNGLPTGILVYFRARWVAP